MENEYNKTKVDVSREDKVALTEHIEAINAILDKYPYSMDMRAYFVTTMTRAKDAGRELAKQIGYLGIKKQEGADG
jgi:hypothetical protein